MKKTLQSLLVVATLTISAGLLHAAPVTLTPSQDTNIGVDASGASRYANDLYLTHNWYDEIKNVGLIQFDLTAQMGMSLTSGATLNLYHLWNPDSGATFNLYRNTTAWAATGITWDTRPAYDTTPVGSLTITDSFAASWRSFDVSGVTQNWLNGTYANYGFTLERVGQDNPYIYFTASGYEGGNFAPQLVLNPVPEPSTYAMLLAGLGLLGFMVRRRQHV